MILYGLIGYPLTHSRSPELFNRIFLREELSGREYRLFPIDSIEAFPALIRENPELMGLNVTIPYKEKIIPYLDDLDETAAKIGAVNTLLINRDGDRLFLKGFNTDAAGFMQSMDFSGFSRALILGSGGAAKAVAHALDSMNISHQFVSGNPREGMIPYHAIDEEVLSTCRLIINATPAGMHPDAGSMPPIPYERLTPSHFLYDLVYNPEKTLFLKKGEEMKTGVMNGLKMLKLQAEEAWKIWHSTSLPFAGLTPSSPPAPLP